MFATFALGTAVGDLFATTFGLGYLGSALFFCGVILIPWIGWRFLRFNAIFAFWFAYVITRPLGASFADYFSKSKELSGADFGDIQTAAVLLGSWPSWWRTRRRPVTTSSPMPRSSEAPEFRTSLIRGRPLPPHAPDLSVRRVCGHGHRRPAERPLRASAPARR